jgi:O-antigen/teichoic acid export membrane protein
MSLKGNFIYSSILTVSTYLFPLVVYPYVSRTLGLSNIGIVNFVDNLVNYFVLISMMGITTVGVREIAAVRNNKAKLSSTFMSLLLLTAIATGIAIVILLLAMYVLPTLEPYRDLLYVGIVKLIFNLFIMEWFFMGMEDFKYITNRTLLLRCLYVLCIFIFVKQASDYKIYYVISVATVVLNALVNVWYSRRFVRFTFDNIDLRPFYQAFLIMGIYVLLTNVYTSLNPVWLGFVTNTDEVGYFTTATKLHNIIMAVLLSFTNILFPRVSNLLAEGKKEEFWEKINTSFDAIFLFTFPTVCFMLIAGPNLLHVVVGDGFEGSYLPFRIIIPLVLIIGIEQILVIQILMAMHSDKTVLRNSFIGAIVTVVFNLLLTASMGAVGSAIVWVIAECVIMGLSMVAIRKKFNYLMPYKRLFTYCVSYSLLIPLLLLAYHSLENEYARIASLAIITIAYAFVNELFIVKNKVAKRLIVLTLLCGNILPGVAARGEMPIIAYFGVPDWQTTEENFRVFSECGFSVSLYPFYPNLGQLQKACRYAEKHGVQVLAKCPEMVIAPAHTANVLKKEKGFFGYFIKDEPSAPEIHIKEKEIVAIRRYDNEHPCYINLHPYYHEDWVEPTLKVKRYSDYLKIASAASCQQISFDFYPVTTAGIRPTWYQNLEMIRKESSSSGKPFWGFVLSMPHDVPYTPNTYYPAPTMASLRLQVYSNLAYGAQAIQYFTYWTPSNEEGFNFHDAPISRDGKKTKTYALVQQMNKELRKVSQLFYGAKVLSVHHLGGKLPQGTTLLKRMPLNLKTLKVISNKGAIISQIEKDGHRYLAIVNKDHEKSIKILIATRNDIPRHITKTLQEEPMDTSYNISPGDILILRLK